MQEINIYLEKIAKNAFLSSDVPLIMKVLHQDAKNGLTEFTKDDIRMFQVYTFALQQLELLAGNVSSGVHAGDWRQVVDDFSMLKHIMDEMEQKKIISNVSWNAGGMAIFDIPDAGCYREYIYCMLREHINKIYNI